MSNEVKAETDKAELGRMMADAVKNTARTVGNKMLHECVSISRDTGDTRKMLGVGYQAALHVIATIYWNDMRQAAPPTPEELFQALKDDLTAELEFLNANADKMQDQTGQKKDEKRIIV